MNDLPWNLGWQLREGSDESGNDDTKSEDEWVFPRLNMNMIVPLSLVLALGIERG